MPDSIYWNLFELIDFEKFDESNNFDTFSDLEIKKIKLSSLDLFWLNDNSVVLDPIDSVELNLILLN